MGPFLYRLGLTSARHARVVVAGWLLLLAVAGAGGVLLAQETPDSFAIPGTESFDALERLAVAFPGGDGASGQVVLADDESLTAPETEREVRRAVAALAAVPQVARAQDPFLAGTVSPDERTAYIDVQFAVLAGDIEQSSREAVDRAVEPLRELGVQVELGGEALAEPTTIGLLAELVGIAVAAVVLVVTLGTLVAAGLPMLTALVGVGIGLSAVSALTAVVDLTSTASILALMLGVSVGIDYALFVLSRYRQVVAGGVGRREAIGRATATAGGAVVFAGGTVVTALAGLTVVGIPFLTQMGLAAAGTVALAVLIALTLLPALLGLLGTRLEAGRVRRAPAAPQRADARTAAAAAAPTSRWVRAVLRRPVAALLVGGIGLGTIALPALDLRLALPGAEAQSESTSQRRAYDLVSAGFGPGANGPLIVLVDGTPDAAERVGEVLADLPGVASVSPPTQGETPGLSLLSVVPRSGPTDAATQDLVAEIRSQDAAPGGTSLTVTGTTAANIDTSDTLAGALPVYVALVVGLAMLLLLMVFRSLLIPLTAVLGFLLTLAATAGVVVAVFQDGWLAGILGVPTTGPVLSFLPVLVVGIVFGLAMDYQVFLVSRMREHHLRGSSAHDAIARGFSDSARVVTAAAVIMIAVFGGFVATDDPIIKSIGLALAVGVAVDAFVVRMTLVPAVLALIGERAWRLPRTLERLVPHIDLEAPAPVEGDDRGEKRESAPVPVL